MHDRISKLNWLLVALLEEKAAGAAEAAGAVPGSCMHAVPHIHSHREVDTVTQAPPQTQTACMRL